MAKHQLTTRLPLLSLLAAACSQASPNLGTDHGDEGNTEGWSYDGESLYPLIDGAVWRYVKKNGSGQILGIEVVEASATEWQGAHAWLLSEAPNADGEWTESVLIRKDGLILRVRKQGFDSTGSLKIVDYEPGFVRLSEAWTEIGVAEEHIYDRIAMDGEGQNPVTEVRGHRFEVLAVDETVSVPAGTFDCVVISRSRTVGSANGEDADSTVYWFAPGIGKVREHQLDDDEVEELLSVEIPGGASLP